MTDSCEAPEGDARRIAALEAQVATLREALEDIGSQDLIGLTGPARIVAEAMLNVARTALNTVDGDRT